MVTFRLPSINKWRPVLKAQMFKEEQTHSMITGETPIQFESVHMRPHRQHTDLSAPNRLVSGASLSCVPVLRNENTSVSSLSISIESLQKKRVSGGNKKLPDGSPDIAQCSAEEYQSLSFRGRSPRGSFSADSSPSSMTSENSIVVEEELSTAVYKLLSVLHGP